VRATCSDLQTNGNETDVDCGGNCAPCAVGAFCRFNYECAGSQCVRGVCRVPTCDDGVRNQDESDIDCGGVCGPCPFGKRCSAPTDCTNNSCDFGICGVSCTDGIWNGSESDTDCGGPCSPCEAGERCLSNTDCDGVTCSDGECGITCDDGLTNGFETDVDCGGRTCDACGDNGVCAVNSDCASDICQAARCTSPSCSDDVLNQDEYSVDCGGICGNLPCTDTCPDSTDQESLNLYEVSPILWQVGTPENPGTITPFGESTLLLDSECEGFFSSGNQLVFEFVPNRSGPFEFSLQHLVVEGGSSNPAFGPRMRAFLLRGCSADAEVASCGTETLLIGDEESFTADLEEGLAVYLVIDASRDFAFGDLEFLVGAEAIPTR
jgi:hypothetical protein